MIQNPTRLIFELGCARVTKNGHGFAWKVPLSAFRMYARPSLGAKTRRIYRSRFLVFANPELGREVRISP